MKKIILLFIIVSLNTLANAGTICYGCTPPYSDFSFDCIRIAKKTLDAVGQCEFEDDTGREVKFSCEYGNVKIDRYGKAARIDVKRGGKHFLFRNYGTCGFSEYDELDIEKNVLLFNTDNLDYKEKIYEYFKSNNL